MDDSDPNCQHWRVCGDCYGRTHGESMESEIAQLRADLARVTAELGEAIEDRRQARDDAARAAALLAVRTMERDARPAISRKDAKAHHLYSVGSHDQPWAETVAGFERVGAALRAHAAGSGKAEASGGVCDACNDAGTVAVHGKEEQWDEPCLACNGTGRTGGTDV